jgi:hypothetical protein
MPSCRDCSAHRRTDRRVWWAREPRRRPIPAHRTVSISIGVRLGRITIRNVIIRRRIGFPVGGSFRMTVRMDCWRRWTIRGDWRGRVWCVESSVFRKAASVGIVGVAPQRGTEPV